MQIRHNGQTIRFLFESETIRDLWFYSIASVKQMKEQHYCDDPFTFQFSHDHSEELTVEADLQANFKSVITDNIDFTFTSVTGTVLKRQDQQSRYIEFYYNTGVITIKKD